MPRQVDALTLAGEQSAKQIARPRGSVRFDLPGHQQRVLHLLALHPGDALSKDALSHAGWRNIAVERARLRCS